MINISADFSITNGRVKPMHAVNNGPAGSEVRRVSNFPAFREAGIPFARTHDASFFSGYGGEYTVDVHRIFRDFDADENDPASYDFRATDAYMKDIFSVGTEPFYRLGASIEHGIKKGTYPPADFAKWARICEHIIRHYTEGWADGFFYKITYWEVWNEPDCTNADGSHPCFQGPLTLFAELFDVAVKHLKACFPHLKIGGPALASVSKGERLDTIFSEMQKRGTPIDFFSFHVYGETITKIGDRINRAREWMVKYGYGDCELILNEWNYIKGWLGEDWRLSLKREQSLFGAAFIAATMELSQQSPLDMLMYYDARPCGMNGMFASYTYEPLKGYYPFLMFNELYRQGTAVNAADDRENGIFATAAKDCKGNAAMMLTYFPEDENDTPTREVKVNFSNVKNEKGVRLSYYLLDEEHDATLVREEVFTASEIAAYLKMTPYSTYLLKITPCN